MVCVSGAAQHLVGLLLAVSNRKADFMDHYVFVYGLVVSAKHFGVYEKFLRLFRLLLAEMSVFPIIRQFRSLARILPIDNVSKLSAEHVEFCSLICRSSRRYMPNKIFCL